MEVEQENLSGLTRETRYSPSLDSSPEPEVLPERIFIKYVKAVCQNFKRALKKGGDARMGVCLEFRAVPDTF